MYVGLTVLESVKPGTGPVFLSNIRCMGSEEDLLDCTHTIDIGLYCSHERDVGVRCEGEYSLRVHGGIIQPTS